MEKQRIQDLLIDTKKILLHQKEKEILKGENFNIFSILKIETKENKTHSAFLKELMHPDGSHFKGAIFLKLFIEVLIKSIQNNNNENDSDSLIDLNSSKAKVEHVIGPRNDNEKTGGRIDIYIWDKNGKSISIENKIFAADQNVQIERYCNHNKAKNMVFYLTLDGKEPTIESKGNLVSGIDFYVISYKSHILEWLKLCLKESADQPILRETIKQYLILIQKLTFSMDNKAEQEINSIMLKHFEEATYISKNFTNIKKQIGESIRIDVMELLKQNLNNEFNVYAGNNSQIWLKFKNFDNCNLFFGIEYFSEIEDSLDVGVFNDGGKLTLYEFGEKSEEPWWPYYSRITEFEGFSISFKNGNTLHKLYDDADFKKRFELHIVSEIERFINIYKLSLREYLESSINGQSN